MEPRAPEPGGGNVHPPEGRSEPIRGDPAGLSDCPRPQSPNLRNGYFSFSTAGVLPQTKQHMVLKDIENLSVSP